MLFRKHNLYLHVFQLLPRVLILFVVKILNLFQASSRLVRGEPKKYVETHCTSPTIEGSNTSPLKND